MTTGAALGRAAVAPRRASGPRLASALAVCGLLALSGCGMEVQTNQPYTPAEGVNVDVTNSGNRDQVVRVRNLGIISRGPGEGILLGTLVGSGPDALTGVSGTAIKVDGSNGSALSAAIANPVELEDNTLVVLTNLSPLITIDSADLAPGLSAELTLQFRSAGQVTTRVPVLDGNVPQYATITPSPAPSGSSTVSSPSPAPTPSE